MYFSISFLIDDSAILGLCHVKRKKRERYGKSVEDVCDHEHARDVLYAYARDAPYVDLKIALVKHVMPSRQSTINESKLDHHVFSSSWGHAC